jgi:hypothetical protein
MEGGAVKKLDPLSGEGITPEGAGRELETLFERARGDGFTRTETEELWTRVGAAMAPPVASHRPQGAGGRGAATSGSIGAGLKLLAMVAIAGGVVGGGVAYRASIPAPAPVITLRPTHVESAPPVESTSLAPAVSVDDLPRAADPAPVSARARAADRHDVARSAAPRSEVGDPTTPSSDSTTPSTDSTPRSTRAAGSTTEPAVASQEGASQDRTSSPAVTAPATEAADPGPTEGSLLLRARQELASDPSDALALTQEHARRFPSGGLVQEREVLAIEALARLGRTSEAQRRLEAFRARFPRSPHVARLMALVGQ